MDDSITVSMGTCWTIAFTNKGLGDIAFVWVCRDKDSYNECMKKLQTMSHINIIQHGASVVK